MLELISITKTFPGVKALDAVSLRFEAGEIHALVGENGAGKSTAMKIITGIYQPDSGEINFDRKRLNFRNYRDSLREGIDIVHQEIQVIPESSVAENIMLDKLPALSPHGRVDWAKVNTIAQKHMDQVGLAMSPSTPMKYLSAAQKQLAQIAKALSADAKVLLLDEPTSSLTSHEAQKLFALLRHLKSAGKTIIFVSHKFEEIFSLCDRVSVLRDGRCIATRPINELTTDTLVSLMIGRQHTLQPLGRSRVNRDREMLRVKNLSRAGKCSHASFTLYEGEILGFYGLVGSGRTELAKLLIGADRPDSGEILIDGQRAEIRSVGEALRRHGMVYVTENRKEEGLLLKSDIQTNLTLTAWPDFAHPMTRRIDAKKEHALATRLVNDLSIRTPSVHQITENLSGGNQQKVSLGRALARNARILIIDEPTVGVDVGAKEQIHQIIWQLAQQPGRAVIVISSDMPEIIRVASRILVFRNQRIVGEVCDIDASGNTFETVSEAIGNILLQTPASQSTQPNQQESAP